MSKWIFGLLCAGTAMAAIVFDTKAFVYARMAVAYVLLALLFVEIFLVYKFSGRAHAPVPLVLLLAGWTFALGGIALDVGVTVAKTPNLDFEDNPVARAFLDSGCPLWHVRVFAGVAQGGLAVLACVAWTAFLRHRGAVVALARSLGRPRTYRQFLNVVIRGELRPKPIISRQGISLPRYKWYRVTFLMLLVWVGAHLYRWYCGFEWLGLVPARNPVMIGLCISPGFVYFYLWLWFEYRKFPPAGTTAESVPAPNP